MFSCNLPSVNGVCNAKFIHCTEIDQPDGLSTENSSKFWIFCKPTDLLHIYWAQFYHTCSGKWVFQRQTAASTQIALETEVGQSCWGSFTASASSFTPDTTIDFLSFLVPAMTFSLRLKEKLSFPILVLSPQHQVRTKGRSSNSPKNLFLQRRHKQKMDVFCWGRTRNSAAWSVFARTEDGKGWRH